MQYQSKHDVYDEINTFRIVSARRLDWLKAAIVEVGVDLQSMHGTDFAASYMKEQKIDIDVAVRVLAHPLERRIQATDELPA